MSTTAIIVVIVVVVLVVAAALAVLALRAARRRRLQERFGPEYERVVADRGSRREAEHELAERERRHAELPIRALPADAQARYASEWVLVQEQFVDAPVESVGAADRLVIELMAERGYPTGGYQQQVTDLSVEHARTLDHYRSAHEISGHAAGGTATTEDLRQAMVHYRALFEELLGEQVRTNPIHPPT
jgi:hypothetical protein